MNQEEALKEYARLAVRVGVNVQDGQLIVINAPVSCAPFARLCAQEAYRAGAGEVLVKWQDELIDLLRYENEDTQVLKAVAPWRVEQQQNCIDRRCCFLHIESDTPGLLSHIDSEKLQAVMLSRRAAFEKFDYYTTANHGQWSIVAHPSIPWAKKVFPALPETQALDKLWEAVLRSVRIGDGDCVENWHAHNARLSHNCQTLNGYRFRELHFRNCLGTDLRVGLVKNHIWEGGCAQADNGAAFNPNMPTEEVFTMPHKRHCEGRVVATKPLRYQGKLIDGFWFEFHEGKVIDYGAKTGYDVLHNLLEFDAGSRYLGEVALVPYDSPISRQDILFLSTLFDENASCHLALGESYPDTVEDGVKMSREQLEELGGNYSLEHCDFMFGSRDLEVTGICEDGREIPVFESGNFCQASGFSQ